MNNRTDHSATFSSPKGKFQADRCEPVVRAVKRGTLQLHTLARRGYPGRAMPDKMLPEISTVGYWDATSSQDWGLDWHRNEGIELTYLARGKMDFQVDRQSFVLESGQLTVTRPWQRHRVGNPNIGASLLHVLILDVGVRRPNQPWRWPAWFVLAPEDLRRLTTLLSHNEQPVWPANEEIAACFARIAPLVRDPHPTAIQSRLKICLNELFLALLELLRQKNLPLNARLVSTRRTVELFLAALPEHLEHLWTLDEMAEQCGLGRSRFADYCRQILNLSPAEYLIRCRVEAARKMLSAHPEQSITDIALACGFQSSQYFATAFRQRTGATPSEFRDSRRGK